MAAYARCDYHRAELSARKVLKRTVDHRGALAMLGSISAMQGRWVQALAYYKRCGDEKKLPLMMVMPIMVCLLKLGQHRAAAGLLQRFVCLDNDSSEADGLQPGFEAELSRHAFTLSKVGFAEPALQLLEALTRCCPTAVEPRIFLCQVLCDLQRWGALLESSSGSVEIDHPMLRYMQARALLALGFSRRALRLLQALVEESIVSQHVMALLVDIAIQRDDPQDALGWLSRMRSEYAHDSNVASTSVDVLLQLGLIDEARQVVAEAPTFENNRFWMGVQSGRILQAEGRFQEALISLAALRLIHPESIVVCCEYAKVACTLGHFRDALSALADPALHSQCPDEEQALAMQETRCWVGQFNFEAAIKSLEARSTRETAPWLNLVMLVYLLHGDVAQAQTAFTKLTHFLQSSGRIYALRRLRQGLLMGLLKELSSNPDAAVKIRQTQSLERPDRVSALANALREEPTYLGFGLQLLIEFRVQGWIDRPLPNPQHRIPRRVVQFWDDADMPRDLVQTTHAWRALVRSKRYRLFNDRSAEIFLRQWHSPEVLQAFRAANHPAMRSDLFRLAFLARFGGLYADCDDLPIGDCSMLFEAGFGLILVQEVFGSIGNNIIASVPEHPFIIESLRVVVNQILERQGESLWFLSGPGVLTKVFCWMYRDQLQDQRWPKGVKLLAPHQLSHVVATHLPRSYKSDERHWLRNLSTQRLAMFRGYDPSADKGHP